LFQAHGDKYAKCFKKACPFYAELDSLYDGLRNRATGDHVVHLGRKCRTKKSSKENPENIDDPLPEAGPSNNDADTNRAPLAPLNADDTGGTAAENNSYDDELLEVRCYLQIIYLFVCSSVNRLRRTRERRAPGSANAR
jgi:hypothetical protein